MRPRVAYKGEDAMIHAPPDGYEVASQQDEVDRLKAINAELLTELQGFVKRWSYPKKPTGDDLEIYLENARAVIAKHSDKQGTEHD
ncbi:hypothetical protein LCGC14_1908730 [marine sediment metagenome]|uniref:Uncharacterized protein n=1 Tax=marine sediment metagenome TaxID=412755 RepID=A0A0F9FUU1_9ZZZZ